MSKLAHGPKNYYTDHVRQLIPKLDGTEDFHLCLLGFGETMKWLSRILAESGRDYDLYDWRDKFYGYDCCTHTVEPFKKIIQLKNPLIVICAEDVDFIKEMIRILVHSDLKHIPVVFEYLKDYLPIEQETPYMQIAENAKKRAYSMVSNERLFNLMQLVRETKDVSGDIVEFGSFSGGTGAIVVETLKHFKINKRVFLFDTFGGIPTSELGVDYRWSGMFSNASLSEVKDKFSDCQNVSVVAGPISQTIKSVDFPISFAHIDVDTYEAAKIVTSKVWPLLNKGGVLLYDDYGFLQNCLPLTVFVDEFVEEQPNAFKFFLPSKGFFLMKQSH